MNGCSTGMVFQMEPDETNDLVDLCSIIAVCLGGRFELAPIEEIHVILSFSLYMCTYGIISWDLP